MLNNDTLPGSRGFETPFRGYQSYTSETAMLDGEPSDDDPGGPSVRFDRPSRGLGSASTSSSSALTERLSEMGDEVVAPAAPAVGRPLAPAPLRAGDIIHMGVAEVLDCLIEKYLDDPSSNLARWLRSRRTTEVALRLSPLTIHTFDYSARMSS